MFCVIESLSESSDFCCSIMVLSRLSVSAIRTWPRMSSTWSVGQLLNSYPSPSIDHQKFVQIHELSALVPPVKESPEYSKLKSDLEGLIKLVEAIRLVDIPPNVGNKDVFIDEASGDTYDGERKDDAIQLISHAPHHEGNYIVLVNNKTN